MLNENSIRDPYRVIVWGPGAIGKACIREILKRPEFKLVGVLAYSDSKVGKDVGELLDIPSTGVTITKDKEAIYALDADVVLWVGLPFFDMETMEREIQRLLESGKNVVSSVSHHYPPKHGKAYVDRLETACRKGNSSLYGTGENPGYWFERMVPTLTGLCTSVETIALEEFADCAASGTNAETLSGLGFGMTIEQAEVPSQFLQHMWKEYFYVEAMEMVAQSTWRKPIERWDIKTGHYLAKKEIVLDKNKGDLTTMIVREGRISGIIHTFTGYINDIPRVKTRVNWCLGPENSPFPFTVSDMWKIAIEGKPVSLRCEFQAYATLEGDRQFQPGDQTSPTWYATVVPLIQAIPIVVGHKPGIVVPTVFANCIPDFRNLETRTSIVDVHQYLDQSDSAKNA